jgi:hypothetical protein
MEKTAEALVVDASVAAKWYLRDETDVEHADLLLTRFTTGELVLVAPEQIRYEIPATISVATLGARPRMTADNRLYQRIAGLPSVIWISDYQAA